MLVGGIRIAALSQLLGLRISHLLDSNGGVNPLLEIGVKWESGTSPDVPAHTAATWRTQRGTTTISFTGNGLLLHVEEREHLKDYKSNWGKMQYLTETGNFVWISKWRGPISVREIWRRKEMPIHRKIWILINLIETSTNTVKQKSVNRCFFFYIDDVIRCLASELGFLDPDIAKPKGVSITI